MKVELCVAYMFLLVWWTWTCLWLWKRLRLVLVYIYIYTSCQPPAPTRSCPSPPSITPALPVCVCKGGKTFPLLCVCVCMCVFVSVRACARVCVSSQVKSNFYLLRVYIISSVHHYHKFSNEVKNVTIIQTTLHIYALSSYSYTHSQIK